MKKVLALIMSLLIVFSAMTGLTVAANTAITYPEMNNTYCLSTKLDYELNYKGGDCWDTLKYLSNAPVDMSEGWLEFDVYVESADATVDFQLLVRDVDEKTKLAGVGDIESNKWAHKIIPVTDFGYGDGADMSKVIGFYLDGINGNNTYIITNMALTKEIPNKSNVHQEVVAIDNQFSASNTAEMDFGTTYNLNDYIAVEADFYVTSNGTAPVDVRFGFKSSPAEFLLTSTKVPVNEWTHKVIYINNFTNFGADKSNIGTMFVEFIQDNPYSHIKIANISFTDFPEMNNTHSLKTKLSYELNYKGAYYWETDKQVATEAVDMSEGYLEFDVFVESADATTSFWIYTTAVNGDMGYGLHSGTIETNKWVHKVISVNASALIQNFRIDGLNSNNTYLITNMAITDYPEMNNTHSLKTELSYELKNYKGDLWGSQQAVYGDQAIDMSSGYLEFDVFVESTETTVDFNITGCDAHGNYVGSISAGTIETNKWAHKVIGLSFGTLIKYFRIEPVIADTAYTITNMAITGYPEMNNTHYLGLDLETNHSCFKDFNTATNFGTGVTDFTKYDYVEFDVFANGGTESTQRMYFNNEGGKGVFDIKVTPNKWVHVVIPVSDLRNNDGYFGGNATKYESIVLEYAYMESGVTYLIRNMALTNEEEPFETGDANHDEKISIKDLVWMKKCAAEFEGYDYRKSADFNDDGTINSDDLIQMRKLLLGTLK